MRTSSAAPSCPASPRSGSPLSLALALAFLLPGCLNGDNYPKNYASAYCASLFACVADEDEIEFWLTYDDEQECADEVQQDLVNGSVYDAYEEGDRTFDEDAAEACIEEVDQIRDDSSCGSMNLAEWLVDASTEECGDVYPEAD